MRMRNAIIGLNFMSEIHKLACIIVCVSSTLVQLSLSVRKIPGSSPVHGPTVGIYFSVAPRGMASLNFFFNLLT